MPITNTDRQSFISVDVTVGFVITPKQKPILTRAVVVYIKGNRTDLPSGQAFRINLSQHLVFVVTKKFIVVKF